MNKKGLTIGAAAMLGLLQALSPSDAQAMHITEGILPTKWALWWFVVAAPFVAYVLFRLKRMSAAIFPLNPSSGSWRR